MGYEIDFLPVGEESSGGDAIALRYGNLYGPRSEQIVMVIDGGFTDNGKALVEHIQSYYNTDEVDVVISTHSDQDHITGLEVVLEEMQVGRLLMHLPWQHSNMLAVARRSAFKSSALSEKLEASFQAASDLQAIAERKGVAIVEPFAGMQSADGALRILGPSERYYNELLAQIESPGAPQATSAIQEYLKKTCTGCCEASTRNARAGDTSRRPRNEPDEQQQRHLPVDGRWSAIIACRRCRNPCAGASRRDT